MRCSGQNGWHPRLIVCPDVWFGWARGANARGTTQEEGKSSLRSGLPSLLGFPSRALSFLISLLSGAHRIPLSVWLLSVLRIVSFQRCEWGHLPSIFRYSLFTIHHSLFTELGLPICCRRASGLGEVNPKKPPRGVYCDNWETFAYRPRRETAVGPADPGSSASSNCFDNLHDRDDRRSKQKRVQHLHSGQRD